jgi:hypothetical protein
MIKEIIIAVTIGTVVGGMGGWYAKGRDVKADQADELKSSIEDFRVTAQGSIDGLQQAWEHQAQTVYDRLEWVSQLRSEDDAHEIEVLKQVEKSNREMRAIIEGFAMASNLGACQLTPEFVGLWNQARAAVAGRAETDRDGTAARGDEP